MDGTTQLTLYTTEGQAGPDISTLYPDELLELDGLELLTRDLADEYFYDEQVSLSPAFKALISVVVSNLVVPGLGSAVASGLGVGSSTAAWLVPAVNSFASTLIVETLDQAVGGNFDIGAILKAATFSGVSAGLTGAINLETFIGPLAEGSPLTQSLLGAVDFSGGLTVANLLNGAIDSVITSGLSSIVHGTDFGETLSSSLLNMAINLALADVQNGIGDITQSLGLGEGSPAHMLMHALAGCAAAAAQQGSCAAGAAGGIAQSLFAGSLDGSAPERSDYASEQAWQQARQDWMGEVTRMAAVIGAIPGFLFSGGDANNVNIASAVAQSGIANNYLSHVEWTERERERAACMAGDNAACDRADALDDLDQDRDYVLDNCKGITTAVCSQARRHRLLVAAEYIDAMNSGSYGQLSALELQARHMLWVETILQTEPSDLAGLDPTLRSQFESAQAQYFVSGNRADREAALRSVLALGTMLAPAVVGASRGANAVRWTGNGRGVVANGGLGAKFNPARLADHFNRHGSDFGAASATQYQRMADNFLTGPRSSGVLERVRLNGDIVRFDPASDAFGVVSSGGTIRTFYKLTPRSSTNPGGYDPSLYSSALDYFNNVP